jgi:short-subunit dehydrogenase
MMAVRRLQGLRCVVTGASSGIGLALARQLAASGARLIVTARRHDRLQALVAEITAAGGEAFAVTGDITHELTRQQLAAESAQRWSGLDLLVNNAGSGAYGPFADSTPDRLRRMFELDFFAPVELTRACLPVLRQAASEGRRPLVVNVGSVLGHCAVPWKSEYCAAKFALRGWNDSLRAEWSRDGIDLLLASPSTTASEFFERVEVDEGQTRPIGGSRWFPPSSPERVASDILRGIRHGRSEVIPSWGGLCLVWAQRLFPAVLRWTLARQPHR